MIHNMRTAFDRSAYDKPDAWDEIKLKVVHFLEELDEKNG